MNLFDFGYREDEVIWSMCCEDKTSANVSDEKGGPLYADPYWNINSCSFLIMVYAVLEDVLYIKGYFLSVCTSSKWSMPLKLKEISC